MKSEEQTNAEIGLAEQSPLLQAWKNLKNSIFNVLFVLLDKNDDDEEQSFYGIVFESGIDYLQMLAFPFDASVIAVWNGGQTLQNVSTLISRLNISTYLPGVSFQTFLVLLYALILLIILVLLDIIYVSYSFSKKKFRFTWPLIILAQLVPLFVTIFFLPITETLISVVRCQYNEQEGYQQMISFPNIICWQGWHLFHAAVTLIFSSLFVFISSVVALALFEPRMTTNKLAARQNSTGQVVFIMNKIICQLVFSFTPFKQDWVYVLMLFLLSGWLYWTYNMCDPFYNKKVSKFFRLMSSYYFWTNFMLLGSQILKQAGFNGGLVIWLSGLPFIGVIIIFDRQSSINKLFSSNLKFKSGEQLDSHLTFVLQLLQNKETDKNSHMLLIGYIQKHKEICIEDDCPLRLVKKKNINQMSMNQVCHMLIKQIQRMYKVGIKKYPTCTKLCLSFAFFSLEQAKNKNKAYADFSYALKTDPSFQQEFIIYRFKKIIKENLQDNSQENSSDLIELIRFENHISLCEEAMVYAARLHKDFWIELKEESPDLQKLNEIGFKITQTVKKVKENYQQIMKINNSVPEMLFSYSIFLILVLKETNEGKKVLEHSRSILADKAALGETKEKQSELNDLNGKGEHPLVCISSKVKEEGKVISFNTPFTEMSGFMREGLVERDITKIMPDIFAVYHSHLIEKWLQTQNTEKPYMSRINKGYLKIKSGFVLPVEYKVVFNPQQELFYVYFKLNSEKSTNYHVILDEEGYMRDLSALGSIFLNISRQKLKEKEINFSEILYETNFDDLVGKNIQQVKIVIDEKVTELQIIVDKVQINLNKTYENDSEDDHLLSFSENQTKVLGYYVQILKKGSVNNDDIFIQSESQENDAQSLEEENYDNQMEEILHNVDEVRKLYKEPELIQVLMVNLAEKKPQTDEFIPYKLKFKIKTMRLLNNEIKMVYEQENDADFNQGEDMNEDDDDIRAINMEDQNYQAKIRKAINTRLNHKEVIRLRFGFLAFLLIITLLSILEMLFSNMLFEDYRVKGQQIYYQSQESNHLSKFISHTFDNDGMAGFADSLEKHENSFNESRMMKIKLKTGEVVQKNMTDSFIYMYSLLTDHFNENSTSNLDIVYTNYVKYFYPVLNEITSENITQTRDLYIMYGLSFFFGLIIYLVWICIRLEVDRKKFNILLWFLDIPIPYVTFLSEHCDRYLKNFVENKELIEKGINFDGTQLYLQEYIEEQNNTEEQMEEQEKIRKILIIKHRKLSILSKINCSYIKLCWIFLFGLIYPLISCSYIISIKNDYEFVAPEWKFNRNQINWFNYLHFSLYMLQNGNNEVDGISMQEFKEENREKFINKMTSYDDSHRFRSSIIEMENSSALSTIISSFNSVYFNNICELLDGVQMSQCQQISNSAFIGGYSVYGSYLYEVGVEDYEEVRMANEKYGAPALIWMMKTWKEEMNSLISNAISICSIMFYVYMVVAILGFLIGCLMYFSKLNTELNEAIKLLNMIPFKLLSRSRKETRQFLVWIIKEANKKNHEDE